MKLKLYRGIALSESNVDRVINEIQQNGIDTSDEASWHFTITFIKDKIYQLFEKENLFTTDTRPQKNKPNNYTMGELINPTKTVCFADEIGASYYALKHNENNEKKVSILIEIEVDIRDVIIDGRDFLYTCFQFLEITDIDKQRNQIKELVSIFGESIRKYLEKSCLTKEQDSKIALCDLATQDEDVIYNHFLNKKILGGRHNTIFRSAFHVKVPINSDNINSVRILSPEKFNIFPEISFKDII